MNKYFLIALGVAAFILILAFLLAAKAFITVFAIVFRYGLYAIVLAIVLAVLVYFKWFNKKDKDGN